MPSISFQVSEGLSRLDLMESAVLGASGWLEINEYYLGFVNQDDRKFMTEHEYYLSERGLFDGYEIDFEGLYD